MSRCRNQFRTSGMLVDSVHSADLVLGSRLVYEEVRMARWPHGIFKIAALTSLLFRV